MLYVFKGKRLFYLYSLFLLLVCQPSVTLAENASLVQDINTTPLNASSNPHDLFEFKDTLFFVANDGIHGEELWHSKGASSGTTLFADIAEGEESSSPHSFMKSDEFLFFTATEGIGQDRQLWVVDGNTMKASKISLTTTPLSRAFDSVPSYRPTLAVADHLLFIRYDDVLYVANGQTLSISIVEMDLETVVYDMFTLKDHLYLRSNIRFSSGSNRIDRILLSSFESSGGPIFEKVFEDYESGFIGKISETELLFNSDGKIWRYDETTETIHPLTEVIEGDIYVEDIVDRHVIIDVGYSDVIAVSVDSGQVTKVLSYQTYCSKGACSTYPGKVLPFNDSYIVINSGEISIVNGDKTEELASFSYIYSAFVENERLLFIAEGDWWVSDGSTAGTYKILPSDPEVEFQQHETLTSLYEAFYNGQFFFVKLTSHYGYEIWHHDFISNQANLLSNINSHAGTDSADIAELTVTQNNLYFRGSENDEQRSLWELSDNNLSQLATLEGWYFNDDKFLFAGRDSLFFLDFRGLWDEVSGKTVSRFMAGEKLTIPMTLESPNPEVMVVGNSLLMTAVQIKGDRVFYQMNKIDENMKVCAIAELEYSHIKPSSSTYAGGEVYFLMENDEASSIWKTDGSIQGTAALLNSDLIGDEERIHKIQGLSERLLVVTENDDLFAYDIETQELTKLEDFNHFAWDGFLAADDNKAIFYADDSYWVSNGTQAGTYVLFEPNAIDSHIEKVAIAENYLFFNTQYAKFWQFNLATKELSLHFNEGISEFSLKDEYAYMARDDGLTGLELWKMDIPSTATLPPNLTAESLPACGEETGLSVGDETEQNTEEDQDAAQTSGGGAIAVYLLLVLLVFRYRFRVPDRRSVYPRL